MGEPVYRQRIQLEPCYKTHPKTQHFILTVVIIVIVSYLQGRSDGKGAGLDLREQIQQVVYFKLRCRVGEISQDLKWYNQNKLKKVRLYQE